MNNPTIALTVILLAIFSLSYQQNTANQIVTVQSVNISYKSETVLNCTIQLNDASTFDNVTFYRYSSSDVNRTKPIQIKPDGKTYQIDPNSTTSLIIKSPKRTELESVYFCNGTRTGQTILFPLLVLPYLYIPDRTKISPTETTDIDMTCSILFGNNPAGMNWQWLLNGDPVKTSDRVQISIINGSTWQSRLSIREIQLQEGGMYECVVANEVGSTRQSIQVNVHGMLSALWPFLGVLGEIVLFVLAMNFCPTPVKKYIPKET